MAVLGAAARLGRQVRSRRSSWAGGRGILRRLAVALVALAPVVSLGAAGQDDLASALARIRAATNDAVADHTYTLLLETHSANPSALGRIHAAMGLWHFMRAAQGSSVAQWHQGLARSIPACEQALQYPLNEQEALQVHQMLGDALRLTIPQVGLRAADALRLQALRTYLAGLKLAGQLPEQTRRLTWKQTFKQAVVELYRRAPFVEEIRREGQALGLEAAVLDELRNLARKSCMLPVGDDQAQAALQLPPNCALNDLEYEVEGIVVAEMFPVDVRLARRVTNDFKAWVRGTAWLIEVAEREPFGTLRARHTAGCTNGAEIVVTKTWTGKQTQPRLNTPLDVATIASNAGPVAVNDGTVLPHLWLMFASHGYFANLTTNRLTPFFDYNASLLGDPSLRLEAEWEVMPGAVALPWKVVYYSDGLYRFRRKEKPEVLSWRPHDPPYNGGFTNAIYSATGFTNVGGACFPSGFRSEEYTPGFRYGRYDLKVRRRVEAAVTSFRPVCTRATLLPELTPKMAVQDWRLRQAQPALASLSYMGAGRWLSVAEAKAANEARLRGGGKSAKARSFALGVLLALLLAPVALLWVRSRRASRALFTE